MLNIYLLVTPGNRLNILIISYLYVLPYLDLNIPYPFRLPSYLCKYTLWVTIIILVTLLTRLNIFSTLKLP